MVRGLRNEAPIVFKWTQSIDCETSSILCRNGKIDRVSNISLQTSMPFRLHLLFQFDIRSLSAVRQQSGWVRSVGIEGTDEVEAHGSK